jgi:AraC family transcriptional regulator, arabinose operon regulatory protein
MWPSEHNFVNFDIHVPRGVRTGSVARLTAPSGGSAGTKAHLRCGIMTQKAQVREIKFCTPQYALVYMHSGEGTYIDHRGTRWALQAGSIFQRYPNQSHTLEYRTEALRCYIAVPRQVYELLLLAGVNSLNQPVFSVGVDANLVREFQRVRQELEQCGKDEIARVLLQMQALVLRIHQMKRDESPALDARMQKAVQVLSEDVEARADLPEVARKLGMNYSTFRQYFQKSYGMSPREFRVRRRIDRAVTMLRLKDRPLKDIAAELGYSDVYSFCAQFKKIAGVPPGRFRRQE